MKTFSMVFMIVGGLLTILPGVAYMVIFVGLPYPGATLEEIAQQNFHMNITNMIVGVGIVGFWVGLLGGVAKFLFRIFKKRK
jgi:cell division protein FtsX